MVADRPEAGILGARASEAETVARYWSRRLVLPGVALAILMAAAAILYVRHALAEADRRGIREVSRTLSLLVADPILHGDQLEVLKRISMVGTHSRLNIRVFDASGLEVAVFPMRMEGAPQSRGGLESEISSTDGRRLGSIFTQRMAVNPQWDAALVLVVVLLTCFSLAAWWVMVGAKPIFHDLLELNSLRDLGRDIATGPDAGSPKRFRFLETTRVYQTLIDQSRNLLAQERERAIWDTANQVAHDIRSPLTALESLLPDLRSLPEDQRLLARSALNRIRDIANNLLDHSRRRGGAAAEDPGNDESLSIELLSGLIEPLVTEKRLQYRSRLGIDIDARLGSSAYGAFSLVQPREFKRLLSNLINNSVEAVGSRGSVILTLKSINRESVIIEIQDNGPGIPPETLTKLGTRGATHGKPDGTGLGLYHARTAVESWKGSLELRSEVGRGTTVVLRLDRAAPPAWFVSELPLPPGTAVLILDDDASIQQVWQGRLDTLGASAHGIEAVHLSTPTQFRLWVKSQVAGVRNVIYLLDYELSGYPETGLSLAEELGIGGQAILVTSRFEEPRILDGCRRLGTRLIPKSLAGLIPICVDRPASRPEPGAAVLIDDDPLVRMNWTVAAKRAGKALKAYPDAASFVKEAGDCARDTPIYVDSDLGEGIKGEEAAKELLALGFTELRLATGHDPASFPPLPHIKAIRGKEPPWAASA